MKIIISTGKNPQPILMDDDVYMWASDYSWNTDYTAGHPQRSTTINGKTKNIKLSRLIMAAPAGLFIDHINHNVRDCRRCNMRICTRQQNNMNTSRRKGSSSRYLGVSKVKQGKRTWQASIRQNNKSIHLGLFLVEEDAARAYNKAAVMYRGEYAHLNIL